ncbi:MAG: flagellar M-ring protein FliF [Robiginitomaculum sp.]|nr:MAG: flagellar M-ring protein FliF [Robiginitomaculum sp.]
MNAFAAFKSLTWQKQLVAVVSVFATIIAFSFLAQKTMEPKLDLLYSGLEGQVAGEVVAELAAKGVVFEVRGSAIYAEAGRRDSLRMELAKDGLPRQSMAGYELFDNVNSFAMTSDMFNTAYWRAKEGELGRTILGLPNVSMARVHLGTAKRASFSSTPSAQSASVTVRTASGTDAQTAKAIQYLTALAVAGLSPTDVVVIDARAGIVAGPGSSEMLGRGSTDGLHRASVIKENLLSILEARVGSGNARVSVYLDIDRTHETLVERTFDPAGRVVKSQTVTEVTDTSNGRGGAVTVASSLPEGDASQGTTSNASRGETSESIQYELSELVRNTEILPGAIKRMTVAILVNDLTIVDANGVATSQPRSAEEMAALQELALAAAGINAEQGDVLTLKSFPFETPDLTGGVEAPGLFQQFLEQYLWSMVQAGFLGMITLILGMFVVRPLFTPSDSAQEGGGLLPMELMPTGAIQAAAEGGYPAMGVEMGAAQDPVDLLKQITMDNPNEAAELLSSWLDNDSNLEQQKLA